MDSTFTPDDSRRLRLQGFVGSICVGSTGRLGIVTHVQVEHGEWTACGFGLDGKGVWTSGHPTELGTAEAFYHKIKTRFHGRLSALDCLSRREIDDIAAAVVREMGPGEGGLIDKATADQITDINRHEMRESERLVYEHNREYGKHLFPCGSSG